MNKIKDYIKEIKKGCGVTFGDSYYKDMNPRQCGVKEKGILYLCGTCRVKLQTANDILKLVGEGIDEFIKLLKDKSVHINDKHYFDKVDKIIKSKKDVGFIDFKEIDKLVKQKLNLGGK